LEAGPSCLGGRLTYPSHEGSLEGNGSAPLEGRFSYPLTLEGARLGGKAGAGAGAGASNGNREDRQF